MGLSLGAAYGDGWIVPVREAGAPLLIDAAGNTIEGALGSVPATIARRRQERRADPTQTTAVSDSPSWGEA